MGVEEKRQENALYRTDSSGPREGEVENLRDFSQVPSFWNKVHRLSEKLGAETVGVEQLPEEARDVNQKPHSEIQEENLPVFLNVYIYQVHSSFGQRQISTTVSSIVPWLHKYSQ